MQVVLGTSTFRCCLFYYKVSRSAGSISHISSVWTLLTCSLCCFGRNRDFQEVTLERDGETLLQFAAVYGFRNIQTLVHRMRKGRVPYQLVEVLSCPGGNTMTAPHSVILRNARGWRLIDSTILDPADASCIGRAVEALFFLLWIVKNNDSVLFIHDIGNRNVSIIIVHETFLKLWLQKGLKELLVKFYR